MSTILIIDDEENILNGLAAYFEEENYKVLMASCGKDGLALIEKNEVDCVITDLRMDGISGLDVVKSVVSHHPAISVIVLTAHGDVSTAVEAMRMGAYDFLTKPLDLDVLKAVVDRSLEQRRLKSDNSALRERVKVLENSHGVGDLHIIGKSAAMNKVFDVIEKAAPTTASVLITGESGTGKELVAAAIVAASPRRDKPFIKTHCAALSSTLLESELFGHEKGAFTGAAQRAQGRFERANGGTIFLDEIGEIDASTQVKLLRVLQEKTFERVGGEETIKTDVRVIAATNKILKEEVAALRFREDLYYRLNVVNIEVPPLRERKGDIALLIEEFLKRYGAGRDIKIAAAARSLLLNYRWPGNIRQLQNCIESACIMCEGDTINKCDLPKEVIDSDATDTIAISKGLTLEAAQRVYIAGTLDACGGNKSEAAKILGIDRKTLSARIDDRL